MPDTRTRVDQLEVCRLIAVTALSILLTGCATILNGGPEAVRFQTVPDSATVYANGQRLGEAPVTGLLDPSENNIIRIVHEDCTPLTSSLDTSTGAGWVAADILAGLLPVAVDAATGAWSSFEDSSPTFYLDGEECPFE